MTPLTNEGCGVFEYSGTGVAGNTISHNIVNDAYCGVGIVPTDHAETGDYHNTIFTDINTDNFSYPALRSRNKDQSIPSKRLKVLQKQKPGGRLWLNDRSCVRLRPDRVNHV